MKHSDLTELIIGCAFKVHNELGSGFLEKVYQNALDLELNNAGLQTKVEYPIIIRYLGNVVGEYFADILVNDSVIIEIKALSKLDKIHEVQLVNYLKGTGIEIGLLINFGSSVEVKRRLLDPC